MSTWNPPSVWLPERPSRLALVRRARRIDKELQKIHPDAHCELDHENPLQLLVATILSAQCTDVRVNQVTPALFERYPTAIDYAEAEEAELQALIRPTGFYRAKARNIQAMARSLVEDHDGEVPRTMEELVALAGVGRKTANVILGNCFDVPGITVDTHLGRLARRFGWTESHNPDVIESEVGELLPKADWTMASHRIIFHGRRICHARKPLCGQCPISSLCPSSQVG